MVAPRADFDLGDLRKAPESATADADTSTAVDDFVASPGAARTPVEPQSEGDEIAAHHITALLGNRSLAEDNAWDPVDEQDGGGLEYDWTDLDTGHGFEIGASGAWDERNDFDDLDYTGTTYDVYGGYRHTMFAATSWFHPYFGGGLTVVHGRVKVTGQGTSDTDDGTSGGAYVRAGLAFDIYDSWRLGIDYRRVYLTQMDILTAHDADFGQFMLTLGIGF